MGVAAGVTFGLSYISGRKAAKKADQAAMVRAAAERKTLETQQRIADIKANRERRKAFREQRIRRANAVVGAEARGVSGSTGIIGSVASSTSAFSSNVAAANQITSAAQESSIFNIESSRQAQSLTSSSVRQQNYADLFGGASQIFGKY